MSGANPWRGEAKLVLEGAERVLRPSFAALVAAEEELGSLFALVERAGAGHLRLAEVAALFWHCLADAGEMSREAFSEAVLKLGLARAMAPLRALLEQILQGAA
ncbi:MAG TPA: gene transfer agent family protein [Novosphingobium sp.]|nr:gene transfer agent family protein [Novosphingobium sp.]HZV09288.1 gene transfer agent family protein [Novosphingobium sp.]